MNFDLSEEQGLLRDLIEKFAGDRYDPVRRLAYVREPSGFDPAGWATLADMGVLAFPFGEELGGFGGGGVELITIMEAMGRAVAVEPLLPVVILGGGLLERAGTEEQKAEWLPRLISGEISAAFAHGEHSARFNQDRVTVRVMTNGGGGVILNGAKHVVLGGAFAQILLVSAVDASGNVALYLVRGDAEGLRRRDYRLSDGSVASDISFVHVRAEPMAGDMAAIAATLGDGRLAVCAELVGLMGMMFDATLDYVKTRQQFGQPIGHFQAIQHRMADNYARLELARSQLYRAAALDASDPAREAAIAGAKSYISANALSLGEDAVQLHGGIGTTEELMVGQAFKRVLMLTSLFGDSDWEQRRYLALTGRA
ncbi:acyl-CoA dehydrogenase family protein [Sphingobium phenoxybenzoativorans]|uniref:Acyl-CoA dehydrogenase family protein n=1 Tax=Sphingobium phenoxybenzoativorans TaxID=1592790 RepID=A0A975K9W3_9SPHN|nr:acyl-CoA dehydrogenase [Sphingobium phenoxybenzoativorans]QUT07499.1 acyl-CoA dehydrogenase family protein [Sphingobium phenoxybenzoativorans]